MNKNMIENVAENEVVALSPSEIAEVIPASGFNSLTAADLANPSPSSMYCSIRTDGSMKSKAAIFNAVNSPDRKLSEHIGEVLRLRDVVAHEVQLLDENTGEVIHALRTVLVTDDGTTYEAVSNGVSNALERIFQIFGQPDQWAEPIPVKPIQKQTRNGNNKVTTLKVDL